MCSLMLTYYPICIEKKTNNKASRTTQPIYGNLQSCYQKLICKIRQNFRESNLDYLNIKLVSYSSKVSLVS